jgi:hypothetical protein
MPLDARANQREKGEVFLGTRMDRKCGPRDPIDHLRLS